MPRSFIMLYTLCIILAVIIIGCAGDGSGDDGDNEVDVPGSSASDPPELPPGGTLAWATQAGGVRSRVLADGVTGLPDGSVAITGQFRGTATFGAGELNATTLMTADRVFYDAFVARYAPEGTLTWATQVGGAFFDAAFGITGLPDGSVVVTGNFADTVTFGAGEANETTLTAEPSLPAEGFVTHLSDVFVARYAPEGTLTWATQAGGASGDTARGITGLPDGSVVVTGWFRDTMTFGEGEANETTLMTGRSTNMFVAKYFP